MRNLKPLRFVILLLSGLAGCVCVSPSARASESKPNDKKTVREILVPFADLKVILERQARRVFVDREQYEELMARAKKSPQRNAPQKVAIVSSEYDTTIEAGRARMRGQLLIEVFAEGMHAVPLKISGASLQRATLDKRPATLGRRPDGAPILFVEGKGRHTLSLDLVTPLTSSAARQSMRFEIPTASASQMRLSVPGNVEIKSGVGVLSRKVDSQAGVTRFELLLPRGKTQIEMSLNNRFLREGRVVIARSVLVDELTEAYEQLHITASMDVLHGATDRFRFAVPEGFEITRVKTPELSRWVVEESLDQGKVLEVLLRQATNETVVLSISATKAPSQPAKWTMPRFRPLDTAGQVAVVGVLLEERFRLQALQQEGLIPIDTQVLRDTLPESVFQADPAAPRIQPVAAFYAPHKDYSLSGSFTKPVAQRDATSNLLLILKNTQQQMRGAFSLRGEAEKLFSCDFTVPEGWEVTQVTDENNQPLKFEMFSGSDSPVAKVVVNVEKPVKAEQTATKEGKAGEAKPKEAAQSCGKARRVHVVFPRGVPAGETYQFYFQATRSSPDWLSPWKTRQVHFPIFRLLDTTRDIGALAVDAQDDMVVRPEKMKNVTPLDENKKRDYGLGDAPTDLAFRYDQGTPTAILRVERTKPRITAQTFSFLKYDRDHLVTHYEVIFEVEQARTRELSFLLPESTPGEIGLRGLDGVTVEEYSSKMTKGQRQWTAQLAEPRRGRIRLAIDFQYPLEKLEGHEISMPLIRAADVAYQSGIVAVEGAVELDIKLTKHPRKVDVGELVDAAYQPGRRLLGVFGYTGDTAVVKIIAVRHPSYELPSAIVQRAELETLVSSHGVSQTAARFLLRTRATYLEIELPSDAVLWSIFLDEKPSQPQKEKGHLLISLPPSEKAIRDLQIVYEAPVASMRLWGRIQAAAPRLMLRDTKGKTGRPLPLADLAWTLHVPKGYDLVRSDGTVFTKTIHAPTLPITRIVQTMVASPGSPIVALSNKAASEESERRRGPRGSGVAIRGRDQKALPTRIAGQGSAPTDDNEQGFRDGRLGGISSGGISGADAESENTSSEITLEAPAPPTPAAEEFELESQILTNGRGIYDYQSKKKDAWALEGIRSLKIDIQTSSAEGQAIDFASLGFDPRLDVTLVNRPRINLLGWGVALLLFLAGIVLSRRSGMATTKFIVSVVLVTTLVPALTGWGAELGDTFNFACYAALLLIPVCLLLSLGRWLSDILSQTRNAKPAASAIASAAVVLGGLLCVNSSQAAPPARPVSRAPAFAPAQSAANAFPSVPPILTAEEFAKNHTKVSQWALKFVETEQPVKVPEDAIIVPYDPDIDFSTQRIDRLLVPYDRYVELWNQAYPDKKLERHSAPAPYGLANAEYHATLEGEDFFTLSGHLDVDVLVDGVVTVPLQLQGGILTQATIAGEPAQLHILESKPEKNAAQQQSKAAKPAPPTGAVVMLYLSGKGHHRLDLSIRFPLERRGGWRMTHGRVPTAPATELKLIVPQEETEVRLTGVSDRPDFETKRDDETIVTALRDQGAFRVEWRPKVSEVTVDRSLTAESAAIFDVQEDGLRVVWRLGLEFRRGQRDSFTVDIPDGYLVEKVEGANVRGWTLKGKAPERHLEVTLLKAARDQEQFVLYLSRRGAVGLGDFSEFEVPLVGVAEAAIHRGQFAIRRSPLIELRTTETKGVVRADQMDSTTGLDTMEISKSPLGIRGYQAYRFASVPFAVRLSAKQVVSNTTAQLQTLLRIGDQTRTLETRINLRIEGRPIYQARIVLPNHLKIETVTSPGHSPQWSVIEEAGRRVLHVYLATGESQRLALLLRGQLGELGSIESIELPRFKVLDVQREESDLVVQADPAFNVRAQELKHCETVLLNRVHAWLRPDQRSAARLAIHCSSPDYGGKLRVTLRQPRVSCMTITNVLVGDNVLEETIYLAYTIREAGIRSIVFRVPASMRDARISAPLLRQKTIKEIGENGEEIEVTLDLQDEVIGEFRVLVENDRLPPVGKYNVPLPVVKSARLTQQFVVVESVGRDELIIDEHVSLVPLSRQQRDWNKLAMLLPGGITQAYLAEPGAKVPRLVLHTKDRDLVETAGARIEMAKTLLMIDAMGAYVGLQQYYIDNSTEQFLDIQMPEGAELWTAQVAGTGVKPTIVPGTAAGQVRIPLVKTAAGDANFVVALKYGGHMAPLESLRNVNFPMLHTININVELSQVRLRLPESYQWFDFCGTMRLVDEGDQLADEVAYYNKQIKKYAEIIRGENDYARLRAQMNCVQLEGQIERLQVQGKNYSGNSRLTQELSINTGSWDDVQKEIAKEKPSDAVALDNRKSLNGLFVGQSNSSAKNVVQDIGSNFVSEEQLSEKSPQRARQSQRFDKGWIAENKLKVRARKSEKGKGRLLFGKSASKRSRSQPKSAPIGKSFSKVVRQRADKFAREQVSSSEVGGEKQSDFSQPQPAQSRRGSREASQEQLLRYQRQLEMQTDNGANQLGRLSSRRSGLSNNLPVQSRPNAAARLPRSGVAMRDASKQVERAEALGLDRAIGMFSADLDVPVSSQGTGLISLDVELPVRGVEFLLTTPRGEVEISARAVATPLVERMRQLAWVLGLLVVVGIGYRVFRQRGLNALIGRGAASFLIVVGIILFCTGIVPLLSVAAILLGIVQHVRLSIAKRRSVAVPC